jgi:hypothetical protein
MDKRVLGPLRKPGLWPADRVFGMEPDAFRRMIYRLKLPPELAALKPHPHMLRHACGFDLVGRADLQARAAFLGQKRLENTIRHSALHPDASEGLARAQARGAGYARAEAGAGRERERCGKLREEPNSLPAPFQLLSERIVAVMLKRLFIELAAACRAIVDRPAIRIASG